MSQRIIFERSQGKAEVVDLVGSPQEKLMKVRSLCGMPMEFDSALLEEGVQRVYPAGNKNPFPSIIERVNSDGVGVDLTEGDITRYSGCGCNICEHELTTQSNFIIQELKKALQERIDFAEAGKGVLNEVHRLAILDTCETLQNTVLPEILKRALEK